MGSFSVLFNLLFCMVVVWGQRRFSIGEMRRENDVLNDVVNSDESRSVREPPPPREKKDVFGYPIKESGRDNKDNYDQHHDTSQASSGGVQEEEEPEAVAVILDVDVDVDTDVAENEAYMITIEDEPIDTLREDAPMPRVPVDVDVPEVVPESQSEPEEVESEPQSSLPVESEVVEVTKVEPTADEVEEITATEARMEEPTIVSDDEPGTERAAPRTPGMRKIDLSAIEAELAARAELSRARMGSLKREPEPEPEPEPKLQELEQNQEEEEEEEKEAVNPFSLPREMARPVERIMKEYTRHTDFVNWYRVLDIDPLATREEVRALARELGPMVHPKSNPHPEAAVAFGVLEQGFGLLDAPPDRAKFDESLAARMSPKERGRRLFHCTLDFAVKARAYVQQLVWRAQNQKLSLELERFVHMKDRGLAHFDDFMMLPSLRDKGLYLSEVVADNKYTVASLATLTTYISLKAMLRSFAAKRARRISPWKRALARENAQRKAIFSSDDASSRMLI